MYYLCPWCECYFEVVAMNCRVFRHAMYRLPRHRTNTQLVEPHMREDRMRCLLRYGVVIGCGNPLRIQPDGSVVKATWDS
jgi:hypothetical protein